MPGNDDALNRMTETVRSLVEIMRLGNLPAVDLVDERAVLKGAGRAVAGFGEASGEARASAAIELAFRDVSRQIILGLEGVCFQTGGQSDGDIA